MLIIIIIIIFCDLKFTIYDSLIFRTNLFTMKNNYWTENESKTVKKKRIENYSLWLLISNCINVL